MVALVGPTGVLVALRVAIGVMTVGLTIGTVWVPEERVKVWLPMVTTVLEGQYVVKVLTVSQIVLGGVMMVPLTEAGGGMTDGAEVGGTVEEITSVHGQAVMVKVVASVTTYVDDPWTKVVGEGQYVVKTSVVKVVVVQTTGGVVVGLGEPVPVPVPQAG